MSTSVTTADSTRSDDIAQQQTVTDALRHGGQLLQNRHPGGAGSWRTLHVTLMPVHATLQLAHR